MDLHQLIPTNERPGSNISLICTHVHNLDYTRKDRLDEWQVAQNKMKSVRRQDRLQVLAAICKTVFFEPSADSGYYWGD
jgi:hypothetical protein